MFKNTVFKNTVFKVSVSTKKWFKSTMIRCIRTFASTVVATLPTTAITLGSVNWCLAFSSAAATTIAIFFLCLAGLPEVESEESK